MDNAETRRGKKCWHIQAKLGNNGFNDSLLLEHLSYQILRKYFSHLSCYTDLLDLLLRVTYKTIIGQGMDIRASTTRNFSEYDETLYNSIVTYKTAFYTVYLPAALGMVYAGIPKNDKNRALWKEMKDMTLEIGRMFQIQDDYFDCFGTEDVIGKKAGTDIEEGKCTWLFVKAQQFCSAVQLKRLVDNYGSNEPEKVKVVKELYHELNLAEVFAQYQEAEYKHILAMSNELDNEKLRVVLIMFLKLLYKRVY